MMFKNISWSEYLLTVGLVIVLWYLFLGIYHYRKVLKGLLSGKQPHTFLSEEGQEGYSAFEKWESEDVLEGAFREPVSTEEGHIQEMKHPL